MSLVRREVPNPAHLVGLGRPWGMIAGIIHFIPFSVSAFVPFASVKPLAWGGRGTLPEIETQFKRNINK